MSFVKSNKGFYSIRMNNNNRHAHLEQQKQDSIKGHFGNLISSEGQVADNSFHNLDNPLRLNNKSKNEFEIVARCSDYLNSQLSIAPIYEYENNGMELSGNHKKLITETHSFIQEDPAVGTQGTLRIVVHSLSNVLGVKFLNTAGTNVNVDCSVYYK